MSLKLEFIEKRQDIFKYYLDYRLRYYPGKPQSFDDWLFSYQKYDLVDWPNYIKEMYAPVELRYFDPLSKVSLVNELRRDTTLEYKDSNLEGLFNNLQKMLNPDSRQIKSNPYYWTEREELPSNNVFVAGEPVTVTFNKSSYGGIFPMLNPDWYKKRIVL